MISFLTPLMLLLGLLAAPIILLYMLRLRRDDFEDPHELAKFAATAGLSLEEFRRQFEYLVEDEPPPVLLRPDAG